MNPFLMQGQASARVTGATGAATMATGCASARTGAGDYNITLAKALNQNEGLCMAFSRVADTTAYVVHTSDTVKQVLTRTLAPAAADTNFEFLALRLM